VVLPELRVDLDADEAVLLDGLADLLEVVLALAEGLARRVLPHGVEADQGRSQGGVAEPAVHVGDRGREEVHLLEVAHEHRGDGLDGPAQEVGVGGEALEEVAVLGVLEVRLEAARGDGGALGFVDSLATGLVGGGLVGEDPLDELGEAPRHLVPVVEELGERDVPPGEDVTVDVDENVAV
jgi:hypothetical protein